MKPIIHILEDDRDIREILGYVLIDEGFQIYASSSIEEFRRNLIEITPDLMLLDVMLPDGDGRDLCRQLKSSEDYRSIPVILLSAHADRTKIMDEAIADGFIPKPFDIEVLVQTIKNHLPPH